MAEIDASLLARLERLGAELDKRASRAATLDAYYDGEPPIPPAVSQAKATKAYTMLMGLAGSNWAKLIVDSVDERLEVQGFRFGGNDADKDAWDIWQRNGLDADSGLAHQAALANGRSSVIVWGKKVGDKTVATITPEHASTTIVEYAPGSRRIRTAALRRWEDDGRLFATLYLPDGLYKFQQPVRTDGTKVPDKWEQRDVPGENWPLANPMGEVPVIELAVNRRLRPGIFGSASGEFEDSLGHIDRINYTVFAWIVAMNWSGFPLRAQIGDPIAYDDNDEPIRPFDVSADRVVQIENPDGKLIQLPEANLQNYIATAEAHIKHLAAITKTPAHYLLGELVNLSADAIRAAEAGLISKARRHQKHLGEGWEDVMRLAFKAQGDDARAAQVDAEVLWKDPESRSMAERADAASKLVGAGILPWQAAAAKVLQASPQEIGQWETMRAGEALLQQVAQPPAPVPPPAS